MIEIKDLPGYYAGKNGKIYSKKRNKKLMPLRPSPNTSGYPSVCIMVNNTKKTFTVHSIIGRAFLGPLPKGYEWGHANGCKEDSRVANIEKVTHSQNMYDWWKQRKACNA